MIGFVEVKKKIIYYINKPPYAKQMSVYFLLSIFSVTEYVWKKMRRVKITIGCIFRTGGIVLYRKSLV